MRALILDVDERMIAERRRLGLDGRDEMWKGVLHVVPPPKWRHQRLESELLLALAHSVKRRGWIINPESGVFVGTDDYRVPDLVVVDRTAVCDRGVDGKPKLVIEIRSPGDETDDKVPWYLARGAAAVLVVDRDSLALELYTAEGRRQAGHAEALDVEVLGITVAHEGETLRVDGVLLDL